MTTFEWSTEWLPYTGLTVCTLLGKYTTLWKNKHFKEYGLVVRVQDFQLQLILVRKNQIQNVVDYKLKSESRVCIHTRAYSRQKCTTFENILKKGSLMRVSITCIKQQEYALLTINN